MSDDAEPDAVESSMLDDSDSDVSCGFSTVGVDEAGFSGIGEAVAVGVTVEGCDKLEDETDMEGD